MASFFLAIPDSGDFSYALGRSNDVDATLASIRKRVPEPHIRLLVVGPNDAMRVMETACSAMKGVVRTVWEYATIVHVARGASEAGVKMVVDVVRAAAMGDVRETSLPGAAPAPLRFFFAHAGNTAAGFAIGTSSDPVKEARELMARRPGETVTLFSGETARSRELVAAVSAVLSDGDLAGDDKLVDEFLAPVFRAVLAPGPTIRLCDGL